MSIKNSSITAFITVSFRNIPFECPVNLVFYIYIYNVNFLFSEVGLTKNDQRHF
jgi:hypothetical protein